MPDHNDKESKNDRITTTSRGGQTSTATVNNIDHVGPNRIDGHYYASSSNGSVTLHSDAIQTNGKLLLNRKGLVTNDVLILPNGQVHAETRVGGEQKQSITAKLDMETVDAIVKALKGAQKSGGIGHSEDTALHNLRNTINEAIQDRKFDAADNRAILDSVSVVNAAAKGGNGHKGGHGR